MTRIPAGLNWLHETTLRGDRLIQGKIYYIAQGMPFTAKAVDIGVSGSIMLKGMRPTITPETSMYKPPQISNEIPIPSGRSR